MEFMSRLQVICKREQLNIDKETLELMIESTGGDFRQILNQIQLLSTLSPSSSISGVLRSFSKDPLMSITPFEAAKALLIEPTSHALKDRYNMYFSDYEMTPLLVEQNYLDSIKSNGGSMDVVAQMAEACVMWRCFMILSSKPTCVMGDGFRNRIGHYYLLWL